MKTAHKCFRVLLALVGVLSLFACASTPAPAASHGEKVLRVVPQSDLEILDPIWTTNGTTRDHGYMIYDTLFGMDANGQIQPQMVDTYKESDDKKTWTFTLRDGLEFHDGTPVTSEDVIASLQRWGQRDTMGQRLLSFVDVDGWEAVNPKTFRMKLKEPYGLVLESLGKPTTLVPFIMPKRVAGISAYVQINDTTGSGPFIYKKDESKSGEKVVYVRNTKYKPRAEPASGTAGGKVVKVDRVEWVIIKDSQTQINAISAGEIDVIDLPAYEQYPSLKNNPDIQMVEVNPLGGRFTLHFNHFQPPFDNPKLRQAAMAALNQPEFLQTQIVIPGLYRTCFSVYPCNTPYATTKGMDFIAKPDLRTAQQLLKESGYDGTAVIILQPTDVAIIARLPMVAAQLLRQAGFKVDLQSMDYQTFASRRTRKDGWSILLTYWISVAMINPVSSSVLSAACDKAFYGWPCDSKLEKLRDRFARADNEEERKAISELVQVRAMEIGTHVPLGEFVSLVAARKNVTGFVTGFFTAYWNVEKK